jgi:hypothetical protein
MVIPRVKLEGTSIVEGIEILQVKKLRRDGYRLSFFCLAIEDLYLMAVSL